MKRILALMLAALLALSLAACGGEGGGAEQPKDPAGSKTDGSHILQVDSDKRVSDLVITGMKTDKTAYAPGEEIVLTMRWTGTPLSDAWVGIVPAEIPHGEELVNDEHDLYYHYLESSPNGIFTFQAELEPGSYTLRVNDNDSGGPELAWCGFTVGGGGKPITDLTQEELEDLEEALDILEALKPEGWDENSFGMYIYDVWDEEFLPDVLPGPVEGVKPSQTNFKDYSHDVLNSDYSVGPLEYDSYADYREYSVSFYATTEQLDAYCGALEAAGFQGGETTASDDVWREFSYWHADGWLAYIFYNTNDDDGGSFDGCASISLTADLYDRPETLAGVPLPQVGTPCYDPFTQTWYETYNFDTGDMESVQVDFSQTGFPDAEELSWWVFMNYYGVSVDNALAYRDSLVALGWQLQWGKDLNDRGELRCALMKGGVYAVVNCEHNTRLEIGFSDMIENISY